MKTLVVIPTYNEADNVEFVIDAVLREAPEVDVLIVDDSSPDGTGALVTSHPEHELRVFLLTRPQKAGLGAAYRAGFGWAQSHDYDVIVQMDADLSHPPAKVPELIDALAYSDVAIGSRYVDGGGVANWSARRRFISAAGNAYVRLVLRLRVRDATAGFRAFRSSGVAAARCAGVGVQRLLLPDREHLAGGTHRTAHDRGADHVHRPDERASRR